MKLYIWKVPKNKFFVNIIIFVILFTVLTFGYAGGALQAFNNRAETQAIYYGNKNSNKISLMINVYWGNEFIKPILNVLAENEIKTTFFIGGVWANKNLAILNEIIANGHEIANHGYYHKDQNNIAYETCYNEINQTHQLIKNLTGISMSLFAPPSGSYNKTTIQIAESLGYKTILWTRDTIDWRDKDEKLVYSRAIKNAHGGDLILMHPTAQTLNALPNIIKHFKNNGYILTTVSNTLA